MEASSRASTVSGMESKASSSRKMSAVAPRASVVGRFQQNKVARRGGSRLMNASQSLHIARKLARHKTASKGESLCHRASDISTSFMHDLLAPLGKTIRYFGPRMGSKEDDQEADSKDADNALASCSKDDIEMAARQSPLTGWVPAQAASVGIQPPKTPPLVSSQRAALDSSSSSVDRRAMTMNRPLQGRRPAGMYEQLRRNRELQDLGSSCSSDASPVPMAASLFLKNEANRLISSSDLSDKYEVENVLDSSGSQWCSQALQAAAKAQIQEVQESRRTSSARNNLLAHRMKSLMLNRSGSQSPSSFREDRFLPNSSQISEAGDDTTDLYESEAEWIEVTFDHPVLLSCVVVKWGRHFAKQYAVLSQWHPQDPQKESGSTSPFWLPPVAPQTFSLPGEQTTPGSRWCVVHVEQNGSGGTDMIRFGAGPVCTKAIRVRMTRPGNLIGALSVTDCYYSICGLGAVPFRVPVGVGLRAEYFTLAPDSTYGFHNVAEASTLEPSRLNPLPSCRREGPVAGDIDPNDGKFGPAPDPQRRCQFASYTGWLRIDQCGVYEFSVKRKESLESPSEEASGTCSVWINLGYVTAVGESQNQLRRNGPACIFSRPLHTGCHALAIQISLEDTPIDELLIAYKGPDTKHEVRPLSASVLAPPAIADASMSAIAMMPGAANGLRNFDPVCRDQAAPLLAYEVDKFQVTATLAQSLARVFVSLCSEGNENYNDEDGSADEPLSTNSTSKAFPLFPNGTRLSVRVLAEDSRTESTYYFSVQCIERDISRDCFLSELAASTPSNVGGVLYRTFDISQTGAYDLIRLPQVPYMALTLSILVRVPNKDARIYIAKGPLRHRLEQADNLAESGVTHRPMSLHAGRNIFYVRVLSPDKRIVRNWTVEIKRSASSDATVKLVSIEPCGFRQYLPSKDDYRISEPVPFGCNAAQVWVEANHADAKVYVGVDDPRCASIKRGVHRFDHQCQVDGMRVPLRVAWNTIYVRVVAMDNTTSKTYSFHVARRPLSLLSGMVGLGMPVYFASSIGRVPDQEDLKPPALGEGPAWSVGTAIWADVTSESCVSQWVQITFTAPLLVAGIRVHWSSSCALQPMFEVYVRGETPWELTSTAKGRLPQCMPAMHMQKGLVPYQNRSSVKKSHTTLKPQVTRSRWRVDHISHGVAEILDLDEVQHVSIYETKEVGWRLFARGAGNIPVILPAAVCAEQVCIKVVGFENVPDAMSAGPLPLAIDGLELVPMQVSEVGLGFVGEFFLGSPDRLAEGGRPDLAALEPSLDGSDMASLSVRVPASIGAVPWAAQYSGLLDVREPGEYMFWVETNRHRPDQTLMWRLCIDGTILQPPDPKEVPKKKSGKRRSEKGSRKMTFRKNNSQASLGDHEDRDDAEIIKRKSSFANYEESEGALSDEMSDAGSDVHSNRGSGLSPTNSDFGRHSSSGRPRRASRAYSLRSSQSGISEYSDSAGSDETDRTFSESGTSVASSRRHRKMMRSATKSDARSSVKGHSKNKHKGLKRRWLTVNCIAAMSQGSYIPEGMQVTLLPGGHYVRLEVLAFADQPVSMAGINMNEEEEECSLLLSPLSRQITPKSPNSPKAFGDTPQGSPADAALDTKMGGNAGIQVNLAYRGPDTNGNVIVVPPRCIAPIPEEEQGDWRSLVRPTLPLLVHSEVAESWSEAAVAMTAWLEDECFRQQVFGMSAHSIDHEDDWRGKCQLVAVYTTAAHSGARLSGLRFLELEYSEERIPSSLLEAMAAILQSKRYVGMASSTDQFYDKASMKHVFQNMLLVWYLEEEPQTTAHVTWKADICDSPEAAAKNIAVWMGLIGLQRDQLLSMTVHPVRRAGTSQPRDLASSEQYEWLVFYYDQYDPEHMACPEQLTSVRHEVFQTQNTWNWHFEMLKEGNATAQTVVAYTTTSVYVEGRSQCAQIALWQVPDVDMEIACSSSDSYHTTSDNDLEIPYVECTPQITPQTPTTQAEDLGNEADDILDVDRMPDRLCSPSGERGRRPSDWSRSGTPLAFDHSSSSLSARRSSRQGHATHSAMSGRASRMNDLFFASASDGCSSRSNSQGKLQLGGTSWWSESDIKSLDRRHDTPSTCLGTDDDRCETPADSARNCSVYFLQSRLYPESIRAANTVKAACRALLRRDVYPAVLARVTYGDPQVQCWYHAHEYLAQLYLQVSTAVADK